MPAIGIHHIALTVSDFDRSKEFYTKVFGHLGSKPVFEGVGGMHPEADGRYMFFPWPNFAAFSTQSYQYPVVGIWEAKKELRGVPYQRYAAGLHHLAFLASSRDDVDAFHQKLVADGVEIMHPPKEYDYAVGCYAVFFTDPDGVKLEYVYLA